jgi:hypothetical protein
MRIKHLGLDVAAAVALRPSVCTDSSGTREHRASCWLTPCRQILKRVPRLEFEALVRQTRAEHATKGLSRGSQFVAMVFCELGRAHSLREISGGLKSCEGKLAHLGSRRRPAPPCFGVITEGKVHEVKVAQELTFASGTVVVDDRGYNEYRLFARRTD